MKNFVLLLVPLCALFSLSSCQKAANSSPNHDVSINRLDQQFTEYWYAGKAEVVSYQLKQSRYGEIREGKAVLIFVTEPFSSQKQVKLDDPDKAGNDKVSVMKLNFVKKFTTGIYPYSMMLSTFTPVDLASHPYSLKVSMSSQEWCGHTYSQINFDGKKFLSKSFSYFEQEGDHEVKLDKAFLEDEIWNRIRIDYKSLPTGEIHIVSGLFHTRLLHQDFKIVKVRAELIEEDGTATYSVTYPDRELSIHFSTEFPYQINSWEENFTALNGKKTTTEGTFDRMIKIDYWTRNKTSDAYLRDSLNLAP